MSDITQLDLMVTPAILRCLFQLEDNEAFVELLKILEERADGLARWSCLIESELRMRWSQGRNQELSDLLRAWNNRCAIRDAQNRIVAVNNGGAF